MGLSLENRRILVVDDDKDVCLLTVEYLRREKADVQMALSGEEALKILESFEPELILLDQNMPKKTGLETLREMKVLKRDFDVVFLSAQADSSLIAKALDAGADDFVRKPYSHQELLSRIRVRFRLRDLRRELEVANAKLADLSEKDDLTGLYNMRSMYQRIETELKRADRSKKFVGCVMFDMDYFKSVNDGHDHLFGSFVLKEVGRILAMNIRETDYAARYGGDEFMVVLSDTDETGVKLFAERVCQVVRNHVFSDGKDSIKLTVSVGYSLSNDPKVPAKELIRSADHALFASKQSGRNRVTAAPALTPTTGKKSA